MIGGGFTEKARHARFDAPNGRNVTINGNIEVGFVRLLGRQVQLGFVAPAEIGI